MKKKKKMEKKVFKSLFCLTSLVVAGSLCYHTFIEEHSNKTVMCQMVLDNVNALSEPDEASAGRIYTCYNKISSNEAYGAIFNAVYCANCASLPVTKVWEKSMCRIENKK